MAELERDAALREAVLDCLFAILSPSGDIRAAAEQRMKALEVTEEFGVILAECVADRACDLATRQLASVLLKQYVEHHWSSNSEKFKPPETVEPAKIAIRGILPLCLGETVSKIRSSAAYAISAIAQWDWPDAWPELFDVLMQALTGSDPSGVHGAMRVLTEFTRELTDTQMPGVARVIFPELYKIFTHDQVYTIRTRCRAVDIFNTCMTTIFEMTAVHKDAARDLLYPILPRFAEALVHSLQAPDGPSSDCGLRSDVLKALTVLVKNASRKLTSWFHVILPPVWQILANSASIYVKTVVNDVEEADDPVDSDGETIGFDNLIYSVFDFIHALVGSSKLRKLLIKNLEQLLYYAILYTQVTEEQCQSWMQNPDQYVEDEDEESYSYSIRISAQDLLEVLIGDFDPRVAAVCLGRAVSQHLQEAEKAWAAGDANWWKIHEAVMLTLGRARELVVRSSTANPHAMPIDASGFLRSVVLADLSSGAAPPLLIGRCIWVASQYIKAIVEMGVVERFLDATVAAIQESQNATVRISAARALTGLCQELAKSSDHRSLLVPRMGLLLNGLLSLTHSYSSEVLALCLETLYSVIAVDCNATAAHQEQIIPLMVSLFLKYSYDQHITSLIQDVIQRLASIDACRDAVQHQLIGPLITILQTAPSDNKLPEGLQSAALDLVAALVLESKQPPDALLLQAFPLVANVTVMTDDNATMQCGSECLRAYVTQAAEFVASWHDEQGRSGLFYIGQTVSKLLDPKCPESAATFVGKLVSQLISKLGSSLGSDLDLMLRAVLSKMQQVETLAVLQELIMVFVRLVHTQLDALLDFLTSVPGPDGQPALHFVLREWCSRQHLFYGAQNTKLGTIALGKLLQYAINSNDQRLRDITVTGDQIFDNASLGVKTRSKKGEEQWTVVPVLVKMYKLLINELSNQLESALVGQEGDDDDEWQDVSDGSGAESDGDEIENNGAGGDPMAIYQCNTGGDFFNDGHGGPDDDHDEAGELVRSVDLRQYLLDFFRSLSSSSFYHMFAAHHNLQEIQVLTAAGIAVH